MTRSELLKIIIRNNTEQLDNEILNQALKDIFNFIQISLLEKKRIEIRNFGIFYLTDRSPRQVRNPLSGTKSFIPSLKYVNFRSSKFLKKMINNN